MGPVATTEAHEVENKGENLWFGIDLNTCTKDQFWDVINPETGNPKAREDYIVNSENFVEFNKRLEEMLKGDNNNQTTQNAAPAQQDSSAQSAETSAQQTTEQAKAVADKAGSEDQTEEMVEISNVKIPKALFGTYLTEKRSPSDAIVEALKGNFEKDKTIEQFKGRNSELSGKTITLQQQLLEATIKAKTAEAQPKQVSVQPIPEDFKVEDIDFESLEGLDLFNPDNHEAVKAGIKKAAETLKSVRQVIATNQAAAKAQQSSTPEPYKPDEDPDVQRHKNDIRSLEIQRDLFEIDSAASQMPQLKMSKPFAEVDAEVSAFYDRIKLASGMQGDRMIAVKHYFGSSPESNAFREICVKSGIVPPADFEKHQIAFRAYQNRKNDMAALRDEFKANPPPQYAMSSYIATELQKSALTTQSNIPATQSQQTSYQQVIDDHVRKTQANTTPTGTIPDIPPNSTGSQPLNASEAEQNAIAMKVKMDPASLTKEEAEWWCNAVTSVGLSIEDVPQVIRSKVKG